jgi:hypothetical protein
VAIKLNEGRRQEGVFVTGIYAPLQKFFALKGEVLDPIFSIKNSMGILLIHRLEDCSTI